MTRTPITDVAVRFHGTLYSLPRPNRHYHVIAKIAEETQTPYVDAFGDNQGFLDAYGHYLTRRQALVSALENNQVKDPSKIRQRMLFSEDLW